MICVFGLPARFATPEAESVYLLGTRVACWNLDSAAYRLVVHDGEVRLIRVHYDGYVEVAPMTAPALLAIGKEHRQALRDIENESLELLDAAFLNN